MKVIERILCQVENDCNLDHVYDKFNELTGLNLEWEVGQDYGTGCYGINRFINDPKYPSLYPTLKELEEKIQKYKNKTLDKYDGICEDDVINYLRRKGILPEQDLLFNVDY